MEAGILAQIQQIEAEDLSVNKTIVAKLIYLRFLECLEGSIILQNLKQAKTQVGYSRSAPLQKRACSKNFIKDLVLKY